MLIKVLSWLDFCSDSKKVMRRLEEGGLKIMLIGILIFLD